MFGRDEVQHVCSEPDKDHNNESTVLKVKHGGGIVIIWGYINVEGIGEIDDIYRWHHESL